MSREPSTETHGNRTVSDRRTFLGKAGATVGVGIGAYVTGIPAALAASASRVSKSPTPSSNVVALSPERYTDLSELSREAFSSAVRTRFVFRSPSGTTELTLVGTEDLLAGKPDHSPVTECFSLQFRGSANRPLDQGSYSVRHGQLGTFDLFVVPSGREGPYQLYVAIFNRVASPMDAIP